MSIEQTQLERRWHAIRAGESADEGTVICGVRTTGIYCRPGCPARTPKRENVTFFSSTEGAREAGLRACRRCRPNEERMVTRHVIVDSPIGELLLVGDGRALCQLHMMGGRHPVAVPPAWSRDDDVFAGVAGQLEEYFAGERTSFDDVELEIEGSSFQREVWAALCEIPYGETWSYKQLANHIGKPSAVRAVGLANGRNPVAVIVPCHRVIGADGTLTGYGGGLERKRLLLDLEAGALSMPAA